IRSQQTLSTLFTYTTLFRSLYATNKFEVAKHHVQSAEAQGATVVAITVDRSGGRNQETLFRLMKNDTRTCSNCHDNSSLAASQRDRKSTRLNSSHLGISYAV